MASARGAARLGPPERLSDRGRLGEACRKPAARTGGSQAPLPGERGLEGTGARVSGEGARVSEERGRSQAGGAARGSLSRAPPFPQGSARPPSAPASPAAATGWRETGRRSAREWEVVGPLLRQVQVEGQAVEQPCLRGRVVALVPEEPPPPTPLPSRKRVDVQCAAKLGPRLRGKRAREGGGGGAAHRSRARVSLRGCLLFIYLFSPGELVPAQSGSGGGGGGAVAGRGVSSGRGGCRGGRRGE